MREYGINMDGEPANKRIKASLFTPHEKQVFTDIVEGHLDVLDNKSNNSKTIFMKQQTWNIITDDFNITPGVTHRSKAQLKNLWKNMKCRAKCSIMPTTRFLNSDYGDLNSSNGFQQSHNFFQQSPNFHQFESVMDTDNDGGEDFPANITIKEEPNDEESNHSTPRSTRQQSRDDMSSPERSRSREAEENVTALCEPTSATDTSMTEKQAYAQESPDKKSATNARIPTAKAIQPKYTLNSTIQTQLHSNGTTFPINKPVQFSTTCTDTPTTAIRTSPKASAQINPNHSPSVPKSKWQTEPVWNLQDSENSARILEMAETEHKRKMEMMAKEHEKKIGLMEKEHKRKLELFSLKEEVLLLKKRKLLGALSAQCARGNGLSGSDMQPF